MKPMPFVVLLSLAAMGTQAQNASMPIADFEGKTIETVHGLTPAVIADEQLGGTSGARLTWIQPGAEGSRGALRISYQMTSDFATPFAGAWAPLGPKGLAADLSAYRGVRFRARTKGGSFRASIFQMSAPPKVYMAAFEAGSEWTLVELPFETFRRVAQTGAPITDPAPLVPTNVTTIGFNLSPELRGQFELDIDHWELYR